MIDKNLEHEEELFDLLRDHEKEFDPPMSQEKFGLNEDEDLDRLSREEVLRRNFDAIFRSNNHEVVIAIDNGTLVGCAAVSIGYSNPIFEEFDKCVYVLLVLVHDRYRREGIATNIYQMIERKIVEPSEYDWVATRTQGSNEASQKFKEKQGLKKLGKTKEQGYTQIYYGKTVK